MKKNVRKWEFALRKVSDNNLKFSDYELQETHFHAF